MKEIIRDISFGMKRVRYRVEDVYENDELIDGTVQKISDNGKPEPESEWVPYCNWCDPDIVWDDGFRSMNNSEMCPKCREDPSWCRDRVRSMNDPGEPKWFNTSFSLWDQIDKRVEDDQDDQDEWVMNPPSSSE